MSDQPHNTTDAASESASDVSSPDAFVSDAAVSDAPASDGESPGEVSITDAQVAEAVAVAEAENKAAAELSAGESAATTKAEAEVAGASSEADSTQAAELETPEAIDTPEAEVSESPNESEVQKTEEAAAAAEEPAAEEPAAEEPAAEEPVAAAEESAAEEPAPAAEEPAAEEPVAAAEEPAAEEPAAAAEEPVAEEPAAAAEEPAVAAEEPAAAAEEPAAAGETSAAGAEAADESESNAENDEEMRQLQAAMAAKLAIDGKVIGWNRGGYHVAIGKIAAFCPVSQIEIGNPRSPKKYLDKSFPFHIIEIQKGGRRVVVSRATAIKADRAEKAAKVREQLEVGAVLKGRVSSITDFGAFVNLGGGIEGLVHVSEISRQRVEHAKEVLKVGKKVDVKVLKVEKGGKRISLSMKRLEPDPWAGVAERFPASSEFTGKAVRATEFGLFVEVEPGLEGLVHVSRLPLGMTLEHESLAVGQEIKGWVHEVERKRRRLSLSLQPVAEGNPWKTVGEKFPEGEIVTGTVERLAKFGAFIQLEPGLTGLLPFAVVGGVSNPKRQFQIGKQIPVKVLSIDVGRKRISLGTEQSKAEGSPQDYKAYVKEQRRDAASGMSALAAAFAKAKDDTTP